MIDRGFTLACAVACLVLLGCDEPTKGIRVALRANGDIQWQVDLPHEQSTKATSLRDDPGAVISDLSHAGSSPDGERPNADWFVEVEPATPWRLAQWTLMAPIAPSALSIRTAKTQPWFTLDPRGSGSGFRTRAIEVHLHIVTSPDLTQMILEPGPTQAEQAVGAFPSRARQTRPSGMQRATLRLDSNIDTFVAQTLKTYAITDVAVSADLPTTTGTVMRVARMLRAAGVRVGLKGTTLPLPETESAEHVIMNVRISRDGMITMYRPAKSDAPIPPGEPALRGTLGIEDAALQRAVLKTLTERARDLVSTPDTPSVVVRMIPNGDTPWRYVYWTYAALAQAGATTVAFRDPIDGVETVLHDPTQLHTARRVWGHGGPVGSPPPLLDAPTDPLRIKLFRRGIKGPVDKQYTLVKLDHTNSYSLPRGAAGLSTSTEYLATMQKIRRVLESKVPRASRTIIATPAPKGGHVPYRDVIHMLEMARSLGHEDITLDGPFSGPLRGK